MRTSSRRRQSRLALWSRRAGLSAIPVLLLAIIGHRADFFDGDLTLALLAVGLTLAFCAVLAGLIAFGAIWREGRRGFAAATVGLLLGLALLAYPAYLFTRILSLPALADVATSPDDVPEFNAAEWEHTPPTAAALAIQRTAYPDVRSRVYLADPDFVFEKVIQAVDDLGWEILLQTPPAVAQLPVDAASPDEPAPPVAAEAPPVDPDAPPAPPEPVIETVATPGVVEAVARTPVVGFREDVIVRVGNDPSGAIVDVRSASRLFQHDFGSNAARIARFFEALDDRLAQFATD